MILPFFRKENTHLKKKNAAGVGAVGFGLRVWEASGREGAGVSPSQGQERLEGSWLSWFRRGETETQTHEGRTHVTAKA